jgi:ketosteroid isomerase-like protein
MMADSAEDEVRSTFNELVSAINSGDVEALGSLMLKGRDHIHIGSEDSEWWTADQFLENFSNVNVEQGVTAEAGEVTVHVRGDVAWVESQGYFKNASGGERGIRLTGVFVRVDDGRWKSVQSHVSIPVPNDQIFV